MIKTDLIYHDNGTITVQIGRKKIPLRNSGEAEAFIAGFKLAHIKLSEAITPLLEIKDAG